LKTIIFKTALGWMGLGATVIGVAAVVLPKMTRRAVERELSGLLEAGGAVRKSRLTSSKSALNGTAAVHLQSARSAILAYLSGQARSFDVPLDLDGQPRFRRRVWEVLQTIPYGRVRSYGWVARKIGKPKAARAVGGACGANPAPLLVPCHRVVAGNGSLGGFSGGLSVKKQLLELEGSILK
jgi:O-6-methylguanine DNA methyltransferase